VISTVQLGATVDYGILMAQHYIDHRQLDTRKEAAMKTVQTVAGSIIPPALILAAAGFSLYGISGPWSPDLPGHGPLPSPQPPETL